MPNVLPQITYTYTIDSVTVKIQGRESRNIPIQSHGLPGTIVIEDDFIFIALVNPDSYEAAQHTAPIVEYFPNGMSISGLPVYLTTGHYEMMANEQIVTNNQHDPSEGGKTALMDTRLPTYWYDGRKFIHI